MVDSNVLVYHFQPHPVFGPMCNRLMERIERQAIEAFTFSNLLPAQQGQTLERAQEQEGDQEQKQP